MLMWYSGSGEDKFRLEISRKYSLEFLCCESVVGRHGDLHIALQEDVYAHYNNSKTGHIMHPPPGSRPKAVVCQSNASPSSLGRSDKPINSLSSAKHRSAGPHGPPGTLSSSVSVSPQSSPGVQRAGPHPSARGAWAGEACAATTIV